MENYEDSKSRHSYDISNLSPNNKHHHHHQLDRELSELSEQKVPYNVEMISHGKLDAYVDGEQIIDTEYSANLNNGILSLETSSNGENSSQVMDLTDLLEESCRQESLKSILSSLLHEHRDYR